MILEKKALTLAETREIVKNADNPVARDYFKTFAKLSEEKAKKCVQEIFTLNNHKLKEENIIKIVDFLPQDKEELAVVMNDISLNEEEGNAILEIVKKYI